MWLYIIPIVIAVIAVALIAWLIVEVNINLKDICKKLTYEEELSNKKGSTVLLPVTKIDMRAECTTVLPVPIGAEMCHHNMEVITNQTLKTVNEEKCVIILQCIKCGVVDKTIAVTSPVPQSISECRHTWVKEKTITLQSAFEQMEDLLKEKPSGVFRPFKKKIENDDDKNINPFDPATAQPWMFQKKMCLQRICSKCGVVDRAVVSNFDIDEEGENGERMGETQEGGI